LKSKQIAVVATLAAAALFGTSATSRSLSAVEAPSIAIASLRLAVGALGLLAIVVASRRFSAVWELWHKPWIWLMAIGVAGYQALFFVGTGLTGVAIGTIASLALGPLFAGLLNWLVLRIAPTPVWWLSTAIAVVGVGLLSLEALETGSSLNPLGLVAAVGAGFAYAIYTVFGARGAKAQNNPTDVLAAAFTLGALFLLPGVFFVNSSLISGSGLVLVMWLGLVATTLAYVLFGIGLKQLSASTVATLNLAEPVVAALLGVFVVGEVLSGSSLFGAVLIVIALSLLSYSTLREKTV
jgi:drug/metabolite transporter, DME family